MDAEFEKTMSIFGKAYELVYADEQSQPKKCMLAAEQHVCTVRALAKFRCMAYIITKSVTLTAQLRVFAVFRSSYLMKQQQALMWKTKH